jgi:hypothetical protein
MLPAFMAIISHAQQLSLDSNKINRLIEEWNNIHNRHNHDAFENIYDDHVIFYAERIPRTNATLLKKLSFVRNPSYRQRITSDIKYILHTNGVIKCDFVKEEWKNSKWVAQPMYLLVGYRHHGYWIIGESDYDTDRRLRFEPPLGETANVEVITTTLHSTKNAQESSALALTSNDNFFRDVLPFESSHIFILLAILGTGGLVFLLVKHRPVTTSISHPKESKQKMRIKLPSFNFDIFKRKNDSDYDEPILDDGDTGGEAFQIIETKLKHRSFKTFVLRLFDPVFFHLVKNHDKLADLSDEGGPDLEFEYRQKQNNPIVIYVHCIYREDTGATVQVLDGEMSALHRGMPADLQLYYVIGVGGPPDRPDEIYLIPWQSITGNTMTREELKVFRKQGSFRFDASGGKVC